MLDIWQMGEGRGGDYCRVNGWNEENDAKRKFLLSLIKCSTMKVMCFTHFLPLLLFIYFIYLFTYLVHVYHLYLPSGSMASAPVGNWLMPSLVCHIWNAILLLWELNSSCLIALDCSLIKYGKLQKVNKTINTIHNLFRNGTESQNEWTDWFLGYSWQLPSFLCVISFEAYALHTNQHVATVRLLFLVICVYVENLGQYLHYCKYFS